MNNISINKGMRELVEYKFVKWTNSLNGGIGWVRLG